MGYLKLAAAQALILAATLEDLADRMCDGTARRENAECIRL
jgi:hypothetical protein